MTFARSEMTTIQTNTAELAHGDADASARDNSHAHASGHDAAERLKMVVRAGNHLDHREIEVRDVEVRFRDGDGQTYRVDLNHPDILRRILRSDVAEPVAPENEPARV